MGQIHLREGIYFTNSIWNTDLNLKHGQSLGFGILDIQETIKHIGDTYMGIYHSEKRAIHIMCLSSGSFSSMPPSWSIFGEIYNRSPLEPHHQRCDVMLHATFTFSPASVVINQASQHAGC